MLCHIFFAALLRCAVLQSAIGGVAIFKFGALKYGMHLNFKFMRLRASLQAKLAFKF